MMKGRTAILVFLLVSAGLAWSAEQKPRLGIIGGGESGGLADLLTVELSRSADVILVERGEIHKVLGELSLSAGRSASDYLKLGRILKADGLLILDPVEIEGRKAVSARLVAVNPGVIIDAVAIPFPVPDVEQWGGMIVKRFSRFFPKLNVRRDQAIPLSFLNIRASVETAQWQDLEHELTTMLAHRLIHESNVFVLERWKMEKLLWEQELQIETNNSFWTGRYLVEGWFEEQVYEGTNVEVFLVLQSPANVQSYVIKDIGKRDELPALVDRLAKKIVKQLGGSSGRTRWDPAEEIQQYVEEARWASVHESSIITREATENAWALGCRSGEVARMRISAYLATDGLSAAFYAHKPDPLKQMLCTLLPSYLRALELFHQYIDSVVPFTMTSPKIKGRQLIAYQWGETEERSKWLKFVRDVIGKASSFLRWHTTPQALYTSGANQWSSALLTASPVGPEDEIARLRKLIRDAADKLSALDETCVDEFKCLLAPYWCDSPEETLKAYNSVAQLLSIRNTEPYRSYRFWPGGDFPWLIAYNKRDADRGEQLLRDYIECLCNSSNRDEHVTGLVLSIRIYGDEDAQVKRVLKLLWDNRQQIVCGDKATEYLNPFADVLTFSHNPGTKKSYQFCRADRQYWFDFTRYFFQNSINITRFLERRGLLVFLNFPLDTAPYSGVYSTTPIYYYSSEEKEEIYRFFRNYIEKVASAVKLTPSQQLQICEYELGLLRSQPGLRIQEPEKRFIIKELSKPEARRLIEMLERYKEGVEEWPHASTDYLAAIQKCLDNLQVLYPPHGDVSSEPVLEVTRFWHPYGKKFAIPDATQPIEREVYARAAGTFWVHHVVCRKGKIWVSNWHPNYPNLFCVDPESFETTLIPGVGAQFDFWQDQLIYLANGKLCRCDLKGRCLNEIALPRQFDKGFIIIDDSLYLNGAGPARLNNIYPGGSGVLKVNLISGDIEVLASSRRRPALTVLDNRAPYNLLVFAGSQGELWGILNDEKLYAYKEEKKDWEYLGNMGRYYCSAIPVKGGTLLSHVANDYVIGLFHDRANMELLLGAPGKCKLLSGLKPRWERPAGFMPSSESIGRRELAYDGRNLWALWRQTEQGADPRFSLIYFDGDSRRHVVIPLRLKMQEKDAEEFRKLASPKYDPNNYRHYASVAEGLHSPRMFFDQEGIVLMGHMLRGFWFIPMKDLQDYIARKLKRGNEAEQK